MTDQPDVGNINVVDGIMTLDLHPEQLEVADLIIVDGIFVKVMRFPVSGMINPQHAHAYDHLSYIIRGAVRIDVGGACLGEFSALARVVIKAGMTHYFTTLAPDTVVLCIHNTDRSNGDVETVEGDAITYNEV
jgi:hypothetical protein